MILLNFIHSLLMLLGCILVYYLYKVVGVSEGYMVVIWLGLMTLILTLGDLIEEKIIEFFNRESMQDGPGWVDPYD